MNKLGRGTFLADHHPTFKQGTDFPPAGDASLAGVLTQGYLQEEDRNSAGEQEDQVGDEERT